MLKSFTQYRCKAPDCGRGNIYTGAYRNPQPLDHLCSTCGTEMVETAPVDQRPGRFMTLVNVPAPWPYWPTDTPLDEAIGEAIGAASVCWTHPEGAGVYLPDQATEIVKALLDLIQRKQLGPELSPPISTWKIP